MESGLEGRNNFTLTRAYTLYKEVSMESGLEGRNNFAIALFGVPWLWRSQWSPA